MCSRNNNQKCFLNISNKILCSVIPLKWLRKGEKNLICKIILLFGLALDLNAEESFKFAQAFTFSKQMSKGEEYNDTELLRIYL